MSISKSGIRSKNVFVLADNIVSSYFQSACAKQQGETLSQGWILQRIFLPDWDSIHGLWFWLRTLHLKWEYREFWNKTKWSWISSKSSPSCIPGWWPKGSTLVFSSLRLFGLGASYAIIMQNPITVCLYFRPFTTYSIS